MEVYFNELSKVNYHVQFKDVQSLNAVYSGLKKNGISVCRIDINDYQGILKDLEALGQAARIYREFLFAFMQPPYESDIVEEKADLYSISDWKCDGESCFGLALAYLQDSVSVSIGCNKWDSAWINAERDGTLIRIRNLLSEAHLIVHGDWLEQIKGIDLVECHDAPDSKQIHLTDDHGKDELLHFSKRLVKSKYVCGVMDSLAYQPRETKFIRKIRDGGLIEIVLIGTDRGLSLLVKTTGRTKRETELIARILEKNYGKY